MPLEKTISFDNAEIKDEKIKFNDYNVRRSTLHSTVGLEGYTLEKPMCPVPGEITHNSIELK